MAKKVNKVPFPDWLLRTPCEIRLNTGGVTEDGDREVYIGGIKEKCIYSEASKRIYDKDGKTIELVGQVIVKGDIASRLKNVSDGEIIINDKTLMIHSAARPRNPDGTVHHTEFQVK